MRGVRDGAGQTMTPSRFPRPAQERAFLQSVVYAALFDYPLTLPQLCEALIGEEADEAALREWYKASQYLQAAVDEQDGYYFPRGRHDLVAARAARERESRKLLRRWSGPLTLLTRLPFVRMVALSGSLAHLNGEADADLDVFVVTSPHRVWSVTVTALLIARLFGWRKRLCLNYVVSERALWVGPADLFSANQIVHLQPITGEATYRKFLAANRFVERFYPNFVPRRPQSEATPFAPRWARLMAAAETVMDWTIAPAFESLCALVYRTHLRRRAHTWQSRDQVRLEPECLKLHTSSHRREVMERFERALDGAMEQVEVDTLRFAESSRVPAFR